MTKNILGTGLSGLVGSRIVEQNPDITFEDLSLASGVNILEQNGLNTAFEKSNSDVVIHAAAFTDTNSAWDQKGDKNGPCYQLNVVGTQNIIEMCRKFGKYLIHISTDFVFDGKRNYPYTENDIVCPIDWYGETKAIAEDLVLKSNIPASIVRIAFPYRSNFTSKVDLVRKIISRLETGQQVVMFTDQITTPTFIDDIAAGLRRIADTKAKGIFHLVGSSSQSPYDLALAIANTFGFDKSLVKESSLQEYMKTSGARPYAQNLALDNTKFLSHFFRPKNLIEGLGEVKNQLHR